MVYIDFDGVILDTEGLLFEEWRKLPNHHLLSEEEKIKYIQKVDWSHVLKHSLPINDSLYYLGEMDPNQSFILTKIHSLENEGVAKIRWIREMGIKQSVILVPYLLKKTDMVDAKDNILIDDCLNNLDDWIENDGYPILFDMNDDNYDSWNQLNRKNYPKVFSLSKFRSKS